MHRLDPAAPGRHLDAMYRAAWALCGSPADAEDLVRETWARGPARRRITRGGERAHLMQALHATHAGAPRPHSRGPRTEAADGIAEPTAPLAAGPGQFAEAAEILAGVAELPEDLRTALVAVDVLGLSYVEAARALETREAAITSRVSRARQRLAKRFVGPTAGHTPAHAGVREGRGVPARAQQESPRVDLEPLDHRPLGREPTREEARLARFADGTLGPAERARAAVDLGRSPELAAAHAEQLRAMALLRAANAITAPTSLRERIDGRAGPREASSRRQAPEQDPFLPPTSVAWRRSRLLPAATALAILVIALVVSLGATHRPSVESAARLALAPSTAPAPAPAAGERRVLSLRGAGLPFPSNAGSTRWTATGARTATVDGRQLTAVVYRDGAGARAGYTIVSGRALTPPSGSIRVIARTRYVLSHLGAASVITWVRAGHTCVIAGHGLSSAALLGLAADAQRTPA